MNLRLRRNFSWSFIVADVQHPILGADFLGHYELDISVHNRKLIDTVTGLSVNASHALGTTISMATQVDKNLQALLRRFPSLSTPCDKLPPVTQGDVTTNKINATRTDSNKCHINGVSNISVWIFAQKEAFLRFNCGNHKTQVLKFM